MGSPEFSIDPVSVGNPLQKTIMALGGRVPEKLKGSFGLRAEMSSGELPCALEALFFKTDDDIIVEMRRVSGDAVLFVKVFQKLIEDLKEYLATPLSGASSTA